MLAPTPTGECSPDRRDFGLHMLQLARRWRAVVNTELKDFGVTQATWRALFHVGALGDGVRPKDLAEALEMERPSLTQLLDRLEASGLVTRHEDPSDHRCKRVFLTEQGEEVHRRTLAASSRVAQHLMASVSDEELATVQSVFARITDEVGTFGISQS